MIGITPLNRKSKQVYARWVAEGEKLGFDRPPRRYGMEPMQAQAARVKNV